MQLDNGKPIITEQELQIIYLLAEGDMALDIAQKMNRSLSTIQGRIKDLRFKVGARNSAHLVALAYHEGILKGRR